MKKLALEGYEDVDSCVNSIEGENLLHENGVKTLSLKPDVYFVPWIVYAGVRINPLLMFVFSSLRLHFFLEME